MIWIAAIAGFVIGCLVTTLAFAFWVSRVAESYDEPRGGYDN